MKVFLVIFLLFSCAVSYAQNSTVTATVTDTLSIPWINGTWTATLNNPQGGQPVYANNGQRVITGFQGTMDGTGTFSVAGIAKNAGVVPNGTSWRFTVCPAATSTNAKPICYSLLFTVSQDTTNLSTQLSAIAISPTNIAATQLAAAYTSASIAAPPSIGYTYFDSEKQALGTWNGNQWVYGGGGGTLPTANCASFPGTTADQKISACIAALPSTGGIANAQGITGAQHLAAQSNWNSATSTAPIQVQFGPATYTLDTLATGVNAINAGNFVQIIGCGLNCTTFVTPVATNDFGHPIALVSGAHDIEVSGIHFEGNANLQNPNFEHQDSVFTQSNRHVNIHDLSSNQVTGSLVQLFGAALGAINIVSNVCTSGACTITVSPAQPTWTTSTHICIVYTWGGQTLPGASPAPADRCVQIGSVTSPTVFTYTNGTLTSSTTTAGLVFIQNVQNETAFTVPVGSGVFQFALAHPQVPPGTVVISTGGNTFIDNNFSALLSTNAVPISTGFQSGSVDYATGKIVMQFSSATATSISSTTTVVTIVGTNTFSVGQQVHISGMTSPLGVLLNGTTQTVASAVQANYTFNFSNAGFASVSDTGFSTTAPPSGSNITASYVSGTMGYTDQSTIHDLSCTDSLRGCVSIIAGRENQIYNLITKNRYGFQDVHIEPNGSAQWVDHNQIGPNIQINTPAGGGISSTHQTNANIQCSGNNWHDIFIVGGGAIMQRCPLSVFKNITIQNTQTFQTFTLNSWGTSIENLNIVGNPQINAPPTNTTGAFGLSVSGQLAANQSGAPIGYGKNILSNIRIDNAWGTCLLVSFSNDTQLTNIQCLNVQNSQNPVLLTTANGFNLNNSTNLFVNGARIDDTQTTPTMQRGISDISNTNLSLNNVVVSNAQNAAYLATTTTGTNCYNVTGCRAVPVFGFVSLAAGTATVTTTAACVSTAASCNYQLSNCAATGTPGELSVGTVVAGTSFVINSANAADTSRVCWRIN